MRQIFAVLGGVMLASEVVLFSLAFPDTTRMAVSAILLLCAGICYLFGGMGQAFWRLQWHQIVGIGLVLNGISILVTSIDLSAVSLVTLFWLAAGSLPGVVGVNWVLKPDPPADAEEYPDDLYDAFFGE